MSQDKAARKQITELRGQIKALSALVLVITEQLCLVGGPAIEHNISVSITALDAKHFPPEEGG